MIPLDAMGREISAFISESTSSACRLQRQCRRASADGSCSSKCTIAFDRKHLEEIALPCSSVIWISLHLNIVRTFRSGVLKSRATLIEHKSNRSDWPIPLFRDDHFGFIIRIKVGFIDGLVWLSPLDAEALLHPHPVRLSPDSRRIAHARPVTHRAFPVARFNYLRWR